MPGKTLFDKIWDAHVVYEEEGKPTLLYIDLQLVHEVTSPQAFEGLKLSGRDVRRPDLTFATKDHNVPTTDRSLPVEDEISAQQMETLRLNCEEHGIELYGITVNNSYTGYCACNRPRAWTNQTWDDHSMRRQPYINPRSFRITCLWNRYKRSRACSGHSVPKAGQAQRYSK